MRKVNVFLLFIVISLGSYAQDSLRFTSTSFTLTSSLSHNFVIYDSLYVGGPTPISDTITYGVRVNSSAIGGSFFNDSTPIPPTDTIYPGLSNFKVVTISITDSAPQFVIGPNTIVIWPIIRNNGPIPFAYIDSIYVYATKDTINTGIEGQSLIKMFIFQTPGHLNVNFGDAQNLVQQVRIYDILGQGIYAGSPDQSRNIPTAGWNTGNAFPCVHPPV